MERWHGPAGPAAVDPRVSPPSEVETCPVFVQQILLVLGLEGRLRMDLFIAAIQPSVHPGIDGLPLILRGAMRPGIVRSRDLVNRSIVAVARGSSFTVAIISFPSLFQNAAFKANWTMRGSAALVILPKVGLVTVAPGFPKFGRFGRLKNSPRNSR